MEQLAPSPSSFTKVLSAQPYSLYHCMCVPARLPFGSAGRTRTQTPFRRVGAGHCCICFASAHDQQPAPDTNATETALCMLDKATSTSNSGALLACGAGCPGAVCVACWCSYILREIVQRRHSCPSLQCPACHRCNACVWVDSGSVWRTFVVQW